MQVKIFDIGDTMDEDHEKDLKALNDFLKQTKGKIQDVFGNVGSDKNENIVNIFHVFYEEDPKENKLSN